MKLTVDELFKKAGVDWKTMVQNEMVDISNKDIKIKSLNINTGEVEYRKVLSLVRKDDSEVYNVCYSNGRIAFKASPNHRVYCKINDKWQYKHLCDIDGKFIGINDKGKEIDLFLKMNYKIYPILDFEVENNNNYFSNNILSHNTTPGGNALKFYSSIRMTSRKKEDILEGTNLKGIKITVKAIKNKVATPMRTDILDLYFATGFDVMGEVIDFAVHYGMIEKGGAWFNIPNVEEKFQGRQKVVQYYVEHTKELLKLKADVLARINTNTEEVDVDGNSDNE